MRARTSSQSICSRSARAHSSTLLKSGSCSVSASSFDVITSSSVEDVDAQRHHLGDRRALDRLVGDRPARRAEDQVDERAVLVPRLVEPALRRALGRQPAASNAASAASASSGLTRKSTSCSLFGPPRAQADEPAAEHERDLGVLQDAAPRPSSPSISSSKVGSGIAGSFPVCPIVQHEAVIRIAAAADIHASDATRDRVERAFADLRGRGRRRPPRRRPDDERRAGAGARSSPTACRAPRRADLRRARQPRLPRRAHRRARRGARRRRASACSTASARRCEIDGLELGVVGTKGFVGGFPGSALPDFGEPLLRRVYAETTRRGRGDRARAAGDRPLRPPDRPPPLRADRGHARGRAGRHPHVSSAASGSRRRSPSTAPTSSCTDTPTPARSRAASATSRSTTSPSTSPGRELLDLRARRQRRAARRRGRGGARAAE